MNMFFQMKEILGKATTNAPKAKLTNKKKRVSSENKAKKEIVDLKADSNFEKKLGFG